MESHSNKELINGFLKAISFHDDIQTDFKFSKRAVAFKANIKLSILLK